jgi:hypothetical protein
MEHLLLVAYWPDRVETYGGRRRELLRLLQRYCRGPRVWSSMGSEKPSGTCAM